MFGKAEIEEKERDNREMTILSFKKQGVKEIFFFDIEKIFFFDIEFFFFYS